MDGCRSDDRVPESVQLVCGRLVGALEDVAHLDQRVSDGLRLVVARGADLLHVRTGALVVAIKAHEGSHEAELPSSVSVLTRLAHSWSLVAVSCHSLASWVSALKSASRPMLSPFCGVGSVWWSAAADALVDGPLVVHQLGDSRQAGVLHDRRESAGAGLLQPGR